MNTESNILTIDLKCYVCAVKVGEYAFAVDAEAATEEPTPEALGLSVRCDDHPEERLLTSPSLPEVVQKTTEELAAEDAAEEES